MQWLGFSLGWFSSRGSSAQWSALSVAPCGSRCACSRCGCVVGDSDGGNTHAPTASFPVRYDQRPSNNRLAAPPYDQRPSNNRLAAPPYDQRPSNNTLAAPPYDQRPSNNRLAAPPYDQRPSNNRLAAPPYDQRPSNNRLAAPPYDQRPSSNRLQLRLPQRHRLRSCDDSIADQRPSVFSYFNYRLNDYHISSSSSSSSWREDSWGPLRRLSMMTVILCLLPLPSDTQWW